MNKFFLNLPLSVVAVVTFTLLQGCSGAADKPGAAGAQGAQSGSSAAAASAPSAGGSAGTTSGASAAPAVTVTTTKAQLRDFPITLVASGTVTPITSVDIRAQTNSTITQVHFKEGDFVKAGQLLFSLDARNDQANLARAQAQLGRDEASLADAKRQYERAQQLLAKHFVSQGAVDSALAQVEAQAAACEADRASIDSARVALSYDHVVAPISARAGQVTLSTGAAVQANITSLVTLVQLQPIDVAFNIPQRNLPDALKALTGAKSAGSPVFATLPDSTAEYRGNLRFVDNQIDPNSGTVKAKAVFENRDSALWPGAFVKVRQTIGNLKNVVVIPQASIIQGIRGTVVYVVDQGRVQLRPVTVLYSQADEAAVSGVQAGETLVLDGKQNVRNNSAVNEKAAVPAGAPPQ